MTKILITGANGFIGQSLCKLLIQSGFDLIPCVRKQDKTVHYQAISVVTVGTIDQYTDWNYFLEGVFCVIHLAARVHIMDEKKQKNILHLYRQENLKTSENLAQTAAKKGVKRFIYLSSIKVNGEQTTDHAFFADDFPQPKDPYALSKWEAEQSLQKISQASKMELVIIRPPLVYGLGVKGNFLRLMNMIARGLPLPLGAVSNKRSMVNVDNLCHLIKRCIEHPEAKGQVFLVSDDKDLSSPELIKIIAQSIGKLPRIMSIPLWLLYFIARVTGKNKEIERLSGSLQVDIQKTKQRLNWSPPYSLEEGIKKILNSQK